MSNLNGSEPKARDWNEEPKGELMRVFNWYSYEKDRKEAHGYVAKENIFHLLWEQDQFLEKYLKN